MVAFTATKVAALALLFVAPLIEAFNARDCTLCWETATNQAQSPACTGIFDGPSLASCLCSAGNQEIFDTCESACAGSDRAPSMACANVGKRDARTCALCRETASNQAHTPICTGLNEHDTTACLCKKGNRDIFNTCNTQCKGFPNKMPKNVCPKVAARADDATCAACWDSEAASLCPGSDGGFDQQLCLCSPQNAGTFTSACDPACANSVVTPAQACRYTFKRETLNEAVEVTARASDKACAKCWNHQIASHCSWAVGGFQQQECLCSPANVGAFIGKCQAPCANSVATPKQACSVSKRDAQIAAGGPCGPVPGTSCNKVDTETTAQ